MNSLKTTLEFCLGLKRPHKGKSVKVLIAQLLDMLPNSYKDEYDNVHCTLGETRTLFSSHTDTVHHEDGYNSYILADETIHKGGLPIAQHRIMYRGNGAPLGADCGAGVAIMIHMIMNGVPGHYVFHAAEEVGGLGSKALAKTGVFNGMFDRAIAFDRKATYSVITHQVCGQCCSTAFAEALSNQLNSADENFMYAPDDNGVYTDTAEYVDQIPECTNISVGYNNEHTANESLNFTFLEQLAAAVLLVKWEELPVGVKDPVIPMMHIDDAFYQDNIDTLCDLLDQWPEVSEEFSIEAIADIANILGVGGIEALEDAVYSGHYTMKDLQDALWDPQGFMNAVHISSPTQDTHENFIN